MKYEARNTKHETNSKSEARNGSIVAISNFGFRISKFKRLKGEQ